MQGQPEADRFPLRDVFAFLADHEHGDGHWWRLGTAIDLRTCANDLRTCQIENPISAIVHLFRSVPIQQNNTPSKPQAQPSTSEHSSEKVNDDSRSKNNYVSITKNKFKDLQNQNQKSHWYQRYLKFKNWMNQANGHHLI